MNVHQKYLNHYTQNMESNNEIIKYFLEQDKVSGTIIRCKLEKGLEMLFFDYYVEDNQEIGGFEKGNLIELFYCLSGNIEMKYVADAVELKSNMIGIYDFNTCPETVIMKKGSVKGISLLLDIDLSDTIIRRFLSQKTLTMKEFQESLEKQKQLFLAFGNPTLRSVFLGIAENPFDYNKDYLLLKAMELVLISSNSLKRVHENSSMKKTAGYQTYEKAVTYMEYHISDPITIKDMAEKMGIREQRLNQYFIEYANQTAHSYLKALRLQRGKQLLIQTDMSVTEIAGEVGWLNASKFAVAFKKKYEMTPQEYRKVNKFP